MGVPKPLALAKGTSPHLAAPQPLGKYPGEGPTAEAAGPYATPRVAPCTSRKSEGTSAGATHRAGAARLMRRQVGW